MYFLHKDVPEETVKRLKDNLKDLDRFLGCYPYDVWKQWKELTNHITPAVVERCSPICGYVQKLYKSYLFCYLQSYICCFSFVRSALELEYCSDALRPRGGTSSPKRRRTGGLTMEEKEKELLPDMKPRPGTELRLSEIPDKHYPDGASPTEITKYCLDASYALDSVLNKLAL